MKNGLSRMFNDFANSEKSAGIILILCTIFSLLAANSLWGDAYSHFWHRHLDFSFFFINIDFSIQHWINDGLMAVFFLMVGLEIERELYSGELSDIRKALLPVFAAIGGMAIPAAIHLALNIGTDYQSGIAIPMATDIAFALAVLTLLGKRVPVQLKVFLTALAIIDDLGAVTVIAIFYSKGLSIAYLAGALGVFGFLILLNRLKVHRLFVYILAGLVMWYLMLKSGVHATIAGVLLAFAVPFTKNNHCPSEKLLHGLHKPVAFIILPLFAIANTALVLGMDSFSTLASSNSLGIIAGLVIGKPVGIMLFTGLAVILGLTSLPAGVRWSQIAAVGFLGGIGFTMSIFISNLAFDSKTIIENSIFAILTASLTAGIAGYALLKVFSGKPAK